MFVEHMEEHVIPNRFWANRGIKFQAEFYILIISTYLVAMSRLNCSIMFLYRHFIYQIL